MQYEVKFIKDDEVDLLLNKKIISILSICFPNQPIFTKQRFYKEKPGWRWFVEENNKIIAHVALHLKKITVSGIEVQIGGVSEVCVLPDYRKKGLVKQILHIVDEWLIKHKYKYAMLFGYKNIYSSSGYFEIKNDIKYVDYMTRQTKIENNIDAMAKILSTEPWPEGMIDLNGFTF